ncbi:MAG: DMT family transporter [Rhabdochlamydiaceae bacterium]|nr:DMT family transporter [Candidatus Amphrikana amoebophyrae]
MNRHNKILLSVCFAITSAIFFALLNMFNKIARTELSTEMALFFRFSIGLVISMPFFLGFKSFSFKCTNYHLHFFRTLSAFFGIFCLVYPLKYIPLVNVVLLGITYPLFVPILVYFIFRKRLSMKMILGIVLGFIGVMFVLQPDHTRLFEFHSMIAVLGGLLIAISILFVRQLHKSSTSEQISFMYLSQATIIATIIALFNWKWPTAQMWPVVIGIGITGAIYQQCLTYALKYAHASLVSPIMYSSILFSALIEFAYWGNIPNKAVWFGFVLIFIGACITVWIQKQSEKLTRR